MFRILSCSWKCYEEHRESPSTSHLIMFTTRYFSERCSKERCCKSLTSTLQNAFERTTFHGCRSRSSDWMVPRTLLTHRDTHHQDGFMSVDMSKSLFVKKHAASDAVHQRMVAICNFGKVTGGLSSDFTWAAVVTVLRRLSKMILSQEWSSEWNLLSTGRVLFIYCQTMSVGFLSQDIRDEGFSVFRWHWLCAVPNGEADNTHDDDDWRMVSKLYILMIAPSLIITSRKLQSRIFYFLDAQVTSISVTYNLR